MINHDSDLRTHPELVTNGLKTVELTFPNGDTEKENSFFCNSLAIILRTNEVQGKFYSRTHDKMDLQTNIGLSKSIISSKMVSGKSNVNTLGESEACLGADVLRIEDVQEKLSSRTHDEMDSQKNIGLSKSIISSEMISDKSYVTGTGESETYLEDILRTEEVQEKLCSRVQDKMHAQNNVELIESETTSEKICDETNVTAAGENETCLELNKNTVESSGIQDSNNIVQSSDITLNDLESKTCECDPVPNGGNTGEEDFMPSAGNDKACETRVALTPTAIRCQKTAAKLNGGLQSSNTSEFNRSAKDDSVAASRLIVQSVESRLDPTHIVSLQISSQAKAKNDVTISRFPSGTVSNKTFHPLAKLLHDIGLDLVTEWVCQDLIHLQTQTTVSQLPEAEKHRQLSVLAANKKRLTKKNKAFAFRNESCRCGFWSESQIVLAFHSQFGDISCNGDIFCCLCSFIARKPRNFIRHMKRRHKLKALVSVKVAQHQCHFCPFESNQQLRIESHLARCRKLFDLNVNLCPVRMDCDIPVFISPKPLLAGNLQPRSTVTSAAASANHVFSVRGKPSQIPFRSTIPSCSVVSQQLQQCATIPPSVTLSLPLPHFIVAPSASPALPRIQFTVVPPSKKNSTQPCTVVRPLLSPLLPVVTPLQPLAQSLTTQSSLQRNLIISSSHTGLVVPTTLTQNLSQTGLTIPHVVAKDAPQSRLAAPSSLTLVQPEACALLPSALGSDRLRMQLLAAPPAPAVQFQTSRYSSSGETRLFQVGNQVCTLLQHQGRSILTPIIFPSPSLPLNSSFTLNLHPSSTNVPAVPVGGQSVQNSARLASTVLSSNICLPRDVSSFVRVPTLQSSTNTSRLSLSMEICELCDGFVKDRLSLSVHFQNAHRVAIGDLNCVVPSESCSLCLQSFFTISGLLRHYHLVHASDSRIIKPLERCSLCQNVNLKNAVEHLSSHHRATMSSLHEFKRCGICSLNLRDFRSFEKHMMVVHGSLFGNRDILLATIAASLMDKTRSACDLNPTDINGRSNECSTKLGKACHVCRTCGTTHLTAEELNNHIISNHMRKCSRCQEAFSSLPALQRHFRMKHSAEREACPLCLKTVQIGRPFIRHMKSQHLKDCSVRIKQLHSSDTYENGAEDKNSINSIKRGKNSLKRTGIPVENGNLHNGEDLSTHSAKKQKLQSGQS